MSIEKKIQRAFRLGKIPDNEATERSPELLADRCVCKGKICSARPTDEAVSSAQREAIKDNLAS